MDAGEAIRRQLKEIKTMFATAMTKDAKEFVVLKLEQYPYLWELLTASMVDLNDGPLFASYPEDCGGFSEAVQQLHDGLMQIDWPNCYDEQSGLFLSVVNFDPQDPDLVEIGVEYWVQLAMGVLREYV